MKNINKMKKIAKNNCGACGDAQASSTSIYVVCFDLSTGFKFDVYLNGNPVYNLSESEIDTLMSVHGALPSAPTDTRSFAA